MQSNHGVVPNTLPSGEGEGLLFYGNIILPFIDRFPKDTELYRIMTTRLSDLSEITKSQNLKEGKQS